MKLTEMIRNFFRWNRKVTNNESKTGQKRRIENKTMVQEQEAILMVILGRLINLMPNQID